jgi:hypothetical protein
MTFGKGLTLVAAFWLFVFCAASLATMPGCATQKEKVYVHCNQFPVRNELGQFTGKYNYVCDEETAK